MRMNMVIVMIAMTVTVRIAMTVILGQTLIIAESMNRFTKAMVVMKVIRYGDSAFDIHC